MKNSVLQKSCTLKIDNEPTLLTSSTVQNLHPLERKLLMSNVRKYNKANLIDQNFKTRKGEAIIKFKICFICDVCNKTLKR